MESLEGLRHIIEELRERIEQGDIEVNFEAIDFLTGGALVINEATGEMQWISTPEPRYFIAWNGIPVQLAERHDLLQNYVLDNHGRPRPTNNRIAAHCLLVDSKARTVAWTRFRFRGYNIEVSTVFLVFNHAYFGGPPVLWETMVFSNCEGIDGDQWRYRSRKEAEKGHRTAVRMARRFIHNLTKHGGRRLKAMQHAEEAEASHETA